MHTFWQHFTEKPILIFNEILAISMSIPLTFLVLMPLLELKPLTIENMGCLRGNSPSEAEKNANFKLNLQNLVHIFYQHFTENLLFFSNEILAFILCLFFPPFHFSFMIKY